MPYHSPTAAGCRAHLFRCVDRAELERGSPAARGGGCHPVHRRRDAMTRRTANLQPANRRHRVETTDWNHVSKPGEHPARKRALCRRL